ncbi:hypothetical protein LGM58_41510 [Burkholderia contaminans]|uniref:hypothetical protein n=1 Tax=Burkholderia contaminans TaxID=488447 RepID=UPI001CF465BB|nr:hypothetical protein [Burkholderia contaminans]MCA7889661.1 hypothetical protein [Burkholderia contaminans]
MTNTIKINGITITGGKAVTVRGGRVIVDGKEVEVGDAKQINIEIHGGVDQVSADSCDSITVNGSAMHVSTMSGDVRCGDVSGSVKTMSGDVHCGSVAGDVSTMSGDIYK